MSKADRRRFIKGRRADHEKRCKVYEQDVASGLPEKLPEHEGFYQCKNCGGGFIAKKADRKRNWAKFCDKSCKAQY